MASTGFDDGEDEEGNLVQKDIIQFKHIITCVLCSLHALAMMIHGQSKLKDAEVVYMRYLYDKHKKELPKFKRQQMKDSSEEEVDSDNSEREVKYF